MIQFFFVRLDLNNDGLISFKEFLRPIAGNFLDFVHCSTTNMTSTYSYTREPLLLFEFDKFISQFFPVKHEKNAKDAAEVLPLRFHLFVSILLSYI
jgi:hypothetical protein